MMSFFSVTKPSQKVGISPGLTEGLAGGLKGGLNVGFDGGFWRLKLLSRTSNDR